MLYYLSNGSILKLRKRNSNTLPLLSQRTIAPLDDFDEELITQLEQEFDGVPSVG